MERGMKGTFREVMNYYASKDLEFDLCCGNVDCSYTFCFSGIPALTDYCEEKYGTLLNAEAYVLYDPTGYNTDSVIVDDCPYELGEKFAAALAGWVSETEYDKLFN